jgi:GTP pyrophosphokinase
MVPLDYALRNGDIAEIITAKSARPSPDWLRITRTSSAKSKIRRFLRQQLREENVARGRDLLDRELSRLSAREAAALRAALEDQLAEIAPDLHLRAAEDVLAAIGYGDLDAEHVFQHLRPRRPPQTLADEAELLLPMGEAPPPAARASVTADGVSGLQTKLSKCCAPLPGDRIVGYVTRGRGLTVHRADCKNLEAHARREPHRVVPLDWGGDGGGAFPTELFVDAIDRVGLLSDITAIISETQINITAANLNTNPQDRVAQLHLTLDIRRREDLDHLIRRLQGLSDVIRVRSPARRP